MRRPEIMPLIATMGGLWSLISSWVLPLHGAAMTSAVLTGIVVTVSAASSATR